VFGTPKRTYRSPLAAIAFTLHGAAVLWLTHAILSSLRTVPHLRRRALMKRRARQRRRKRRTGSRRLAASPRPRLLPPPLSPSTHNPHPLTRSTIEPQLIGHPSVCA
jgi:hypothetical protein